jgi:hypothetical protein
VKFWTISTRNTPVVCNWDVPASPIRHAAAIILQTSFIKQMPTIRMIFGILPKIPNTSKHKMKKIKA